MDNVKLAVKAAHYDIWMRFSVILMVFSACWSAAVTSSWLIAPDFWWAFILYGAGVGLLVGIAIKIKYSLSSVIGAVLAIVVSTASLWSEKVSWFPALLFTGLTIILIGFGKFQLLKILEYSIQQTKNHR